MRFPSVDHFEVVRGVHVGGANEKDILEDPETGARYIAKLGRRNNDLEVTTEFAIFLIGRSIGVNVADARVASYKGQVRFLSRYFLEPSEELVHGLQIFSELFDEATVKGVVGDQASEQAMFSVQAVKTAFGAHYLEYGADVEDELFGGFVAMLAHGALIGVQDRHHENWGVVVVREVGGPRPRFSPLFDSARGLFCNRTELDIRDFFGVAGQARLSRYIEKSRPLVGFDGLLPTKPRRFVNHAELLSAVFHRYPKSRPIMADVLGRYDWRLVRSLLKEQLGGLCSPQRLQLVLTCLRRRLRHLHRAINDRMAGADI